MAKPQEQKTLRDTIRETFTPSRVGLLSWAFIAVIMGTIGVASYQFGGDTPNRSSGSLVTSGLVLPPAGDIETTASTPATGRIPVEILQVPHNRLDFDAVNLNQSQIEVLQREIVGLRRRLSALTEQNVAYSRRIAALEKQVAVAKLSDAANPITRGDASIEPAPGVVITRAKPDQQNSIASQTAVADNPSVTQQTNTGIEMLAGNKRDTTQKNVPPRRIAIYTPKGNTPGEFVTDEANQEPVRIVQLPQVGPDPIVTGSIPTQAVDTLPEQITPPAEPFDANPTQTRAKPAVISPSSAAGRLRGGGENQIKRSDFGAVIGHYRNIASAAKAWADFKEQNEERMRDLRPLLMNRQGTEGGIALLVGPFGNAADAAVACLHLLDVTSLCHPALYAGEPLIAAAEFRDTAF
ncbi:hypothetical protein [uncultured Roseibium sp.]|uniref:hypothetical protein n=1 Tax=uncultured Roseibium sp. TaxID=1936171 RepID=UPI002632F1F7|nr:hypothetical protein [uncultured Roseibium sp.]